MLESLTLLGADTDVVAALDVLRRAGIKTGEQFDHLQKITPTKQASRKAKRALLDELVRTEVGKFFMRSGLKPVGRNLDETRDNFKVVKSKIDLRIKQMVPSGATSRADYSASDLDNLIGQLPAIVAEVEEGLRRG